MKTCKNGHKISGANVYWRKDTRSGNQYAVCRTCRNAAMVITMARRRERLKRLGLNQKHRPLGWKAGRPTKIETILEAWVIASARQKMIEALAAVARR